MIYSDQIFQITIADPFDETDLTLSFTDEKHIDEFLDIVEEKFNHTYRHADGAGPLVTKLDVCRSPRSAAETVRQSIAKRAAERLGEVGRIALDIDMSDYEAG